MGRRVWSVESREALAGLAAAVAELAAIAGAGDDCADQSGIDESGVDESGIDPFRDGAGPSRESGSDPWDDPLQEVADACLDRLAALARKDARSAALRVRLTAEYAAAIRAMASPTASVRDRSVGEMAMVAELACVLTVSENAAGALLDQSQALTTTLPLTLDALQAGTISWAHARIMVDEATDLGPDGAAALEAHFLDPGAPNPARGCPAGELVPGRFRAKSRTWRERHHPVSIEDRHTRCATDRRVEYRPDRDGMAWLSAYLPAVTAAGIWDRMTAAARALQGPDEPRTLTQLRADTAATLLLGNNHTTGACTGITDGPAGTDTAGGGSGTSPGACGGGCGKVPVPRAQVLVTVPVLSLLGATEEPAMLDGYGPIPPSMARALVADGAESFHRVLTDPRDGAPLEIGRTGYRLPKAMRQWLRLRDGRCPFPGCNNPSLDNDADHLLAWADGGTTGITNLGQPCRKHHRLKHGSTWTPAGATQDKPPGWTSPSGRQYTSEAQDWEPPHWPPHLLATIAGPDESPPEDGCPPPDDRPGADVPADPAPHPGWDPNLDLPEDPGRDPKLDLPPDDRPDPEVPKDPAPHPGWDPNLDPPPDDGPDSEVPKDPEPYPGWDSDPDLPPDDGPDSEVPKDPEPYPGWASDQDLPPDPDWNEFTAGLNAPAADPGDPCWQAPLEDPCPEWLLVVSAGRP